MSLLQEIINLSKLYGIKPTKQRGQNFLIEEKVYDNIVAASNITKDKTVLEVGPGLGFLTTRLANRAKQVIAVELDKKICEALANRLQIEQIKNVLLFNEDVMNFEGEWAKSISENKNLIVVANLPYTITSTFLRFFIGGNKKNILPEYFVLMLQKEVAERLRARPGEMSILALSVQLFADVEILFNVARKSFWPAPAVDSAVVKITRHNRWLKKLEAQNIAESALLRLIKIGFSARRKMLKANLAAGFQIPLDRILEYFNEADINPGVRAQELSLDDWLKLLPFFS